MKHGEMKKKNFRFLDRLPYFPYYRTIVLNLKVILSRISTCLKNSVKNYQFKKQHISRPTKKVMGTKKMRKTKSYLTKEKILNR